MQLHLHRTFAAAVAAAGIAIADPTAAEPQVGLVALLDYRGAVGTRVSGERRALRYEEAVYADERVETGAAGSTLLTFLDETSLSVGPGSSVVLDKFVYDPTNRRGDVAISFLEGSFRFVTGQILNKENVSLRTPTASLVIRGTDLLIRVFDSGATAIDVREGAVDVQICGVGQPVRVGAGQSLTVSASCTVTRAPASADPARRQRPARQAPDLPADPSPAEPPSSRPPGEPAPGPEPTDTALVGLGVAGLGIAQNLGGLIGLADDPLSNGRIAGIGLASGDRSGNGGLAGVSALGGDDSGNGGLIGAGLLSGARSGNGAIAGLAIGAGPGSGQGDLVGASLLGEDGLVLSIAGTEIVGPQGIVALGGTTSVLGTLTDGLRATLGRAAGSTGNAADSGAPSAGSGGDNDIAGSASDDADDAAGGASAANDTPAEPAGETDDADDGGLVGAVGKTVDTVGKAAGGLLGGIGDAVGGLGKALGGGRGLR